MQLRCGAGIQENLSYCQISSGGSISDIPAVLSWICHTDLETLMPGVCVHRDVPSAAF